MLPTRRGLLREMIRVAYADGAGGEGFTLIEILIAMSVAAIGLFSLAHLQCVAIKGNASGERYTQATFLAQRTLERLKNGHMVKAGAFGFNKMVESASGTIQDAGAFAGINENGDPGGPFNIQWEVAGHTQWSRRVTVTVSWKGVRGRNRNLRLVSSTRGDGK